MEQGGGLYRHLYLCFGTWYYGWRHATEVARQLQSRSADTEGIWSAAGFDERIAQQVCEAIKDACGWPNRWFVPDDPLDVVLDVPFDALAIVEFAGECEDRLGVVLEPGILSDAVTVGDVVQVVTKAVRNKNHL